jgi:hypothetical protein
MKRDKKDAIFSNLVRERANWTCECCGKYYPEGGRQGLHCSHTVSRRFQGLRYHPMNASAHCYSCHQRLGGHPLEFAAWIEAHIGKENAENLRVMSTAITKLSKADKEDIYQNMKASYETMLVQRADGGTGRLEFPSPYPD